MRLRFALLVLLTVAALAAAGCTGDPPSGEGEGAPSTTAEAAPDTTATPPATRAETTRRAAPQGLIPAARRQPAPEFRVTDFDGRTITLGGFRGQPVVVHFFESW
jgi:cytochrome oxidase Cu insertion factor (SCO1/SenC/PrrC family)